MNCDVLHDVPQGVNADDTVQVIPLQQCHRQGWMIRFLLQELVRDGLSCCLHHHLVTGGSVKTPLTPIHPSRH